jgi:hypothetical protein
VLVHGVVALGSFIVRQREHRCKRKRGGERQLRDR